ncbi:MAG: aldo/keto reductase [Deltaproteobacteria bacterium]|nr:aldo/keto reductase [Deltaproteobacteria bacterium]
MERRRLGRTGIAVSALGFGASEFGQKRTALKMAASILGSALDAGLNVIDTAACYGNSEELIGRAVGHRRKDFYILTKCGHASGLPFKDWTPALVEPSIDRSLKRLRTDYLDVVQLHSCDERQLRQGELIQALQRARDKGKLRYLGYSGDGDAALYAVRCNAFDTLQISISIADQEAIETILPLARERDLGVIAKRPLANVAWLDGSWWSLSLYSRPYRMRLRKLNYEFLSRDPKEAIATALRFTLSVPGMHTAIVGTTKPSRWQQNAALLTQGPLPQSEYDSIRRRWRSVATSDWIGLE